MYAIVEDGVLTRLEGDPAHPITNGTLCNRGRRLVDRLYDESRILHPLKKVDGEFVAISWDEAFDDLASQVSRNLEDYGHHSIMHAYDWGSGTLLKNLNQRFFYLLGGCTETVGSLCWEAGIEAQRYDFGQARSHAPEDTENSQAIVVWGRNVANTNVHMIPIIKRAQRNGSKLVVVNPLATDLDGRADIVLHPRPGSDAALALGMLNYCVQQELIDAEFIHLHTVGWSKFAAHLHRYTLQETSARTDIDPAQIVELATLYGAVRGVCTLLGIGLQRYPGGGNAIRAIDALAAATGQIGISGGGVQYANRAIPAFIDTKALTGRAQANVREFPRGTQAQDILQADPPIQTLFVTRTNTVTQVPDSAQLIAAYQTVPCKVVIDMFMTKTAEMADYILPCTSVLEEEDIAYTTMWHSYLNYVNPAVTAQGEAKPDWLIFKELADRLGIGEEMDRTATEWMEVALRPLEGHGLTLAQLQESGSIQLPIPDVPWSDFNFLTPSGKFEFVSLTASAEGQSAYAIDIPPAEVVGDEQQSPTYPYALLTVHPRKHENSQQIEPTHPAVYPMVEVSEGIAAQKNLKSGDFARLWNERASAIVDVRVTSGGHVNTVKLESGWWGQGITTNHFTAIRTADFGQQTAQYDCACNLEKLTLTESQVLDMRTSKL